MSVEKHIPHYASSGGKGCAYSTWKKFINRSAVKSQMSLSWWSSRSDKIGMYHATFAPRKNFTYI